MAGQDLSVNVLDGDGVRSEHGEGGEVSLKSEVHVEGSSLGVHGAHE